MYLDVIDEKHYNNTLLTEMNKYPKLLVISDVNVELTSAGSTLLYRLLESYPKEKLCILQSKLPDNDRGLADVNYVQISNEHKFIKRLSNSRLYPLASFIRYIGGHSINNAVDKTVRSFKPDAIVTVTFRFAWILAYQVAKKYKLPLHLILHDDIVTAEKHGNFLRNLIEKNFKKIYRFACSRFCISSNMEEMYQKKYGVGGQVIYPMLARNDSVQAHSSRLAGDKQSLHFCYAGSLYTQDFPSMLDQLALILKKDGHTLTLFTEATKEHLKNYPNLTADHVSINGFIHPNVLRDFMTEKVDVNIMLNSFEEEEAFKWNFSSKLVEYTVVGLPVLMWGPASSGAICWALSNNYEGVLAANSLQELKKLVARFAEASNRISMADHFRRIGTDTFSFNKNYDVFINGIVNDKKKKEMATV